MEPPVDFQELLKAAQSVQSEIGRVQGELAAKTVEGTAGGGMVKALVNGRNEVVSIKIEAEIVDPKEVEMLQDLIVAAVNQGLVKSADVAKEAMSQVAGGLDLNLPGMPPTSK